MTMSILGYVETSPTANGENHHNDDKHNVEQTLYSERDPTNSMVWHGVFGQSGVYCEGSWKADESFVSMDPTKKDGKKKMDTSKECVPYPKEGLDGVKHDPR